MSSDQEMISQRQPWPPEIVHLIPEMISHQRQTVDALRDCLAAVKEGDRDAIGICLPVIIENSGRIMGKAQEIVNYFAKIRAKKRKGGRAPTWVLVANEIVVEAFSINSMAKEIPGFIARDERWENATYSFTKIREALARIDKLLSSIRMQPGLDPPADDPPDPPEQEGRSDSDEYPIIERWARKHLLLDDDTEPDTND